MRNVARHTPIALVTRQNLTPTLGMGQVVADPLWLEYANGRAALVATGTVTVSGIRIVQASASLSGVGTLAAAGLQILSVAAALAGTGTVAAAAWATVSSPPTAPDKTPVIYAEPMFSDVIFADNFLGITASRGLAQPARGAASIRFYDRDGVLKGIISTNTSNCTLSKLQFDLLDSGPGAFVLTLTAAPSFAISHETRIDVHLWNSVEPIYSGFVQKRPWAGSTERTREYSGFGYSEHLNRVLITGEWSNKYVYEIVTDIVKNQIAPITGVLLDTSQIDANKTYLVSSLKFLRTSPKEAWKQLCKLAGNSIVGVDQNRKFFFRAASEAVTEHFWYGRHFGSVTGDEDSSKIANRRYIKLGKVRTDLNVAHFLFKTNWLEEYLENADSIATYGRRDAVYTAPSVFTATDAVRAAAAEIDDSAELEIPIRVKDILYTGEPILASGKMRVVGQGGNELTLPKKKCRYVISGSRVSVDVDLSDLDRTPAEWIADLASREATENLARQQSQQQL